MSSFIHDINVMKGRSRSVWIVMAGVFLTVRVCDSKCINNNFKQHITNNLLSDHWFQMKNFTPTGQEVTLQHEFLSVLHTICSSFTANKHLFTEDPVNAEVRSKVVWTYSTMIKKLVNINGSEAWTVDKTLHFCRHSCSETYGTSFINTTQFEKMYKKVCVWNGTVPECPSQNHLPGTAAPSLSSDRQQPLNASAGSQNFDAQKTKSHVLLSVVITLILIIFFIGIIIFIQLKCGNNQVI